MAETIVYKASPTGQLFHASDAFCRAMIGPYGSGKSVTMVMELVRRAMLQEPDNEGVRRTVFGVVRNTTKQLEDTTMKTFLQWFPDGKFGTLKAAKHNFLLGVDGRGNNTLLRGAPTERFPKGTWISSEIRFRGLDRPDQQKDLLSQEFTGMWFNEFGELSFDIFQVAVGRVGRYTGGGRCTWSGVFMDSNPYSKDTPWDRLFTMGPSEELLAAAKGAEGYLPEYIEWAQPGGLDDNAENLENLPDGKGYYLKMLATAEKTGKSQAWIDRYIHGKKVFLTEGKGVYVQDFNERTHVIHSQNIDPTPGVPIGVGMDFGVSPSAVFGQKLPSGQWKILGELEADGGGAEAFAEEIRLYMRHRGWEKFPFFVVGDPAGQQRSQTDARTPIDVMRSKNIKIKPCQYQSVQVRLESVRSVLRRAVSGMPGIQIDRSCYKLIQGLAGGYEYRKMKTADERFTEEPNKNTYSHLQDALQYLIAEYEGAAVAGGRSRSFPPYEADNRRPVRPHFANTGWNAMTYKKDIQRLRNVDA